MGDFVGEGGLLLSREDFVDWALDGGIFLKAAFICEFCPGVDLSDSRIH